MKESKGVYVTKRHIRENLLHREYQLYSNRVITSEIEEKYEQIRCKDVGVQYNSKKDNPICTCRNLTGLKRHPDARYFSTSPKQIYAYHRSRSFTDVGVGSVKALQKKKVKRIYLPETDDRGVGSSDLSSFVRKNKYSSYYDHKRTSSKCVGGFMEKTAECVMSAKLSPILHTKSGTTSPKDTTENQNNTEIGSNTIETQQVTITTQIETDDIQKDELKLVTEVKPKSIIKKVSEQKEAKPSIQTTAPEKTDTDKKIKEIKQEKSFSSDSLVQHVHNLENPSENKLDTMENKIEKEFQIIFSDKSKDHKAGSGTEKPIPDFKSASLLRRRFDAIRRTLGKKEDSKKNVMIASKTSQSSLPSHRDASVTSDPPSLEGRSYSNIKAYRYNPYTANINEPQASYKKSYTGRKDQGSKQWSQAYTIDSEYTQGVKGMFKLWGKKFNLDDDPYKKETTPKQSSYDKKACYKRDSGLQQTSHFKADEPKDPGVNIITEKPATEDKKEGKKFFFFKKKIKDKEKVKDTYKSKKGVTTGRCEVRDGLMIKIGGAKPQQPPLVSPAKLKNKSPESYEELIRKAWLMKYLTNKIESRNSVQVRWNNNTYATSSSTIFELMENVYKETGVVFKSKSETVTDESSYYAKSSYSKPQNVNFVQNVEAWMIPTISTLHDQPAIRCRNDSVKDMEVRISNQKWFIDKSKAFAHKIEVVLHSNNFVRTDNPKSNTDYLRIDIPKGFFSDTTSTDETQPNQTSDEEVYKIVEYEALKSSSALNKNVNKQQQVTGDHEMNDLQVTISVKEKDKSYESKIIETVIKRPPMHRDVVTQGSNVYIPKKCDVIGVGIITQRDVREVRKPILKLVEYVPDEDSDTSEHITQNKCEFAESYLQDYCRYCSPLGIDLFPWSVSDSHLRHSSENFPLVSLNNGDATKSCPNILDNYITSTIVSSYCRSPSQCCAAPEAPAESKKCRFFKQKSKTKPKTKQTEFRILPKDSFEVFKKRKLYAASNKSNWMDEDETKPYSVPSIEERGAQDTLIDCPKHAKPCCKVPQPKPKKNTCNKHVSLPDCETMNDMLVRKLGNNVPGILTFGNCDKCKKKDSSKRALLEMNKTCEIQDPKCKKYCEIDAEAPCSKENTPPCSPPLSLNSSHKTCCKNKPACPPSPRAQCRLSPPKSAPRSPPRSPPKCPPRQHLRSPPRSPRSPSCQPCCAPKTPSRSQPRSPPCPPKPAPMCPPKSPPICAPRSPIPRSPPRSLPRSPPRPPPMCPPKSPPCQSPVPSCPASPSPQSSRSGSSCPSPTPSCPPSPRPSVPCSPSPPCSKLPKPIKLVACKKSPCKDIKKKKCPKPSKRPPKQCSTVPCNTSGPACAGCKTSPCNKLVSSSEINFPWPVNSRVSKESIQSPCKPKVECIKSCPISAEKNKINKKDDCVKNCENKPKDCPPTPPTTLCPEPPNPAIPPQCAAKCSTRSKISGLFLKKLPSKRKTCASDCKAWSQVQGEEGIIRLNSREKITIKLRQDNPSIEEIRECVGVKIQDEDGQTICERKDYIQPSNAKPMSHSWCKPQCGRDVLVGDMYTDSHINRVETVNKVSSIEKNEDEDSKSKIDSSVANMIEINFKLKVTQGDKTTEIDIGNDNTDKKTKNTTVGDRLQELYVMKSDTHKEAVAHHDSVEDANPKNDINIRILIKNYKPKAEKKKRNQKFASNREQDEFSKKISDKFQTVSTGYSTDFKDQNLDSSDIFSVHRATIDLTESAEKSKSQPDRQMVTNSECITVSEYVTEKSDQPTEVDDSNVKVEDTVSNKQVNKTKSTERPEKTYEVKSVTLVSGTDTDDLDASLELYNKTSDEPTTDMGDDTTDLLIRTSDEQETDLCNKTRDEPDIDYNFKTSDELLIEAPTKTRYEKKKGMLKNIFENGNYLKKPKNKSRIQKLKEMLKAILTSDSSEPEEMVVTSNEFTKNVMYPSLKPNFFRDSESLNNFYKGDSNIISEICSNTNPRYPTGEKNSVCSGKDSEWSKEDIMNQGCVCSKVAARLNGKMCAGGGCCCAKKLQKHEETNCDLGTEEDFKRLDYNSAEFIDVETQNSKYFASKVTSVCINPNVSILNAVTSENSNDLATNLLPVNSSMKNKISKTRKEKRDGDMETPEIQIKKINKEGLRKSDFRTTRINPSEEIHTSDYQTKKINPKEEIHNTSDYQMKKINFVEKTHTPNHRTMKTDSVEEIHTPNFQTKKLNLIEKTNTSDYETRKITPVEETQITDFQTQKKDFVEKTNTSDHETKKANPVEETHTCDIQTKKRPVEDIHIPDFQKVSVKRTYSRNKSNSLKSYELKKFDRNTKLGISDDDKVVFLEQQSNVLTVTTDVRPDMQKKPKNHSKLFAKPPKLAHPADILQLYETKKAVLEIYAEKTETNYGEHLVAKLPKFVYNTESEICRNYEHLSKSSCKRNIVMMSIRR